MQVHLFLLALMALTFDPILAQAAKRPVPAAVAGAAPGKPNPAVVAANTRTLKKAAALKIEDTILIRNCDTMVDPVTRKRVSATGEVLEAVAEVEKLLVLAEASTLKLPGSQSPAPFSRLFRPTQKNAFTQTLQGLKKPNAKEGAIIIFCHPDTFIPTPFKKAQKPAVLAADDGYWYEDGRKRTRVPGKAEAAEHPQCKGKPYYIEPFTNRIHLCKAFWKAQQAIAKVCPGPEGKANNLRAFHLMNAMLQTPLHGKPKKLTGTVTALKTLETRKPADSAAAYAWAGILQFREGKCPKKQTCPGGQTLNARTNKCECPAGQKLNARTKKCECPVGKTLDPKTKKCIAKPAACAAGQKKNPRTGKCECPAGQVLDPRTKRCTKRAATTTCPRGQVKNAKTGKCVKAPVKPATKCPRGQVMDPKTKRCKPAANKKQDAEKKRAELAKKKKALQAKKTAAAKKKAALDKKKADKMKGRPKPKPASSKKCPKGKAGFACKVLL